MKLQCKNYNLLQSLKYPVCLFVLFLVGCAGGASPPLRAPTASEDQSLEPSYTAYTNGLSCKQVSQLLIMDRGRDNLGLMVGAFMTGANYQKKRVSSATISQLLASVNWYCNSHPNHSVTKAMIALDHDIDDGFASSSSVERKPEPSKQSSSKKITKTKSKTVTDVAQSEKQKTKEKSSVKPMVKRKTVVIPKTDPGGTHVVQIMSSQDVSEAQKLAVKLQTKGFPTFVTTVNLGSNGTWHRVLIGPYENNSSAKRVADVLEKFNYKAFVRQR